MNTDQQGATDGVSRRTVLKGMSAAGVGVVGGSAVTDRAQGGAITGGCLVADWPAAKPDRINLAGDTPIDTGEIPDGGDIIIYVHGLFSQDVLDSIDINGANQAQALDEALTERGVDTPVVAGMWNSTTTWTLAKWRANDAGETLARWVEDNYDSYDSITVLAHSLGSRVTLTALEELADSDADISSVGLLGAGVEPDTVCDEFETGIENGVEGEVYNYHSEGDAIVCTAYAVLELTSGLGCEGAECDDGGWWFSGSDDLPANFVDIDLSGTVDGHCNYYKPATMDYSGGSAIPDIVDRQFAAASEDNETSSGDGTDDASADDDSDEDCWLFC